MREKLMLVIFSVFMVGKGIAVGEAENDRKSVGSDRYLSAHTRAFPSVYDQWRNGLAEAYQKAFVAVMNDWYRGKSGLNRNEEEKMIDRFIKTPKDSVIECEEPMLWESTIKDRSLVSAICKRDDFHITLVAWTGASQKLITAHVVGDKARPVTVVGVLRNKEHITLAAEQPPYEGEGTATFLAKWNGQRFVASDWGWK